MGLIAAIWPYSAWYLQLGWKLNDAEPSPLAISVQRIMGVMFVIIGSIMIVSSCTVGGYSESNWPKQFKEKLAAEQVLEINIGMIAPITLTQEETNAMIQMIKAAELIPFEPGNAYGANNTGEIVFRDQTSVKLVFFGPSGRIELHPENSVKKYAIVSKELETWYRTNYSDQ